MIFVPYPLKMDGERQLLPIERTLHLRRCRGRSSRFDPNYLKPGAWVERDRSSSSSRRSRSRTRRSTGAEEGRDQGDRIGESRQPLRRRRSPGCRRTRAAGRRAERKQAEDRANLQDSRTRGPDLQDVTRQPRQSSATSGCGRRFRALVLSTDFREKLERNRYVKPSEPPCASATPIRMHRPSIAGKSSSRFPRSTSARCSRHLAAGPISDEPDVDLLLASEPTAEIQAGSCGRSKDRRSRPRPTATPTTSRNRSSSRGSASPATTSL